MNNLKELTFKELRKIEGCSNACKRGVGLAGIAIGSIYTAAATAVMGPVSGYLAGTATNIAFIEIGSHCR